MGKIRTTAASAKNRVQWNRRRLIFVAPSLALCLLLLGRSSPEWFVLVWIGVGAVGFVLAGWLISRLRDYLKRDLLGEGEVVTTFARMPLDDYLKLSPAGAPTTFNRRRIESFGRGFVEGRAVLGNGSLRFLPGRIAKSAGASTVDVPWSQLTRVEIAHLPLSLNVGLDLVKTDGQSLAIEVRGGRRVRRALGDLN